jgi:hypothetical protein
MMEELNEEKILEVRMYFFVPYNISEIQKGIQCGHAALRYARAFSAEFPEVWEFVDNHETWIILNGGTTNDQRDFEGIPAGTLNQIADELLKTDIRFSYFIEPDLNNALSSLCFLCDERVFNREDFPDFVDWLLDVKMYESAKNEALKNNPEFWVELKIKPVEIVQGLFPEFYKEWIRLLGGVKNIFLRELTRDKKKA